jgi:hypothetical protein
MATLWQCCRCVDGPMKMVNHPICSKCGHRPCKNCKKDGDIVILGSRRTAAVRAYDHTNAYRANPGTNIPPNHSVRESVPATYSVDPNSAQARKRMRLGSRPGPSLRGWWVCHKCDSMNNPELCQGRCTICNHTKCNQCRSAR